MYTPMELANKPLKVIRSDLARIAEDYGPCDIVIADVEADVPDERVRAVADACHELSLLARSRRERLQHVGRHSVMQWAP